MAEYAGKLVVFSSEEEVNQAIKQYEEDTIAHFVVGQKLKGFTSTELQVKRLCWYLNSSTEVKVPYDGIPFSYAGKLVMRCHHGPDKCKKQKVKYKETRIREEAAGTRKYGKHRVRKTPLKKVDCPAKISIKKVVKFPEFKLESGKETDFGKKMMSKSVMEALQKDAGAVEKEVRYYVMFAALMDHKNHEMGELAAKLEPVDERVLNALHSYAIAGVRSCAVLQKLGVNFVENKLFKDKVAPPRSRRRFYPSLSDIRNFLYKNKEELNKTGAHVSLNEKQILSQLDVDADVASTSTAPSSDRIDCTGIVALMNAAVNDQYIQPDDAPTMVSVTDDTTGQQCTVIDNGQVLSVEEIATSDNFSQVQNSSPLTVMKTENLTQTQAFTKPVETMEENTIPELTPTTLAQDEIMDTVDAVPITMNQTTSHTQSTLQQPNHQVESFIAPQEIRIQTQNDDSTGSLNPADFQSCTSECHNNSAVQHQVASTLEELARLPVHGNQAVDQSQQVAKPSRLKLILRLKDLTRQVQDYSLLIKRTDHLQSLVSSLETVVEQANELAVDQPEISQTRKRKASPLAQLSAPKITAIAPGYESKNLSRSEMGREDSENNGGTVSYESASQSEINAEREVCLPAVGQYII